MVYDSNDFEEIPFAEGKTKAIFNLKADPNLVLIKNLDSLTAFNAKRRNEISGKALSATTTTCNIFRLLNSLGCPTHFVEQNSNCEFIAQKCEMIPIEWVARRIATGSFLKRNPGVDEGTRFGSPKIETFFKDDANDDPQWSDEQILAKKLTYCNEKVLIGRHEISIMKRWTQVIFRVLENAWLTFGCCTLVDMKIEFGINTKGEIVLADVIDNDSWRVWPNGDRRLQLDKQFYRDLKLVTDESLIELKKNYDKVAEITGNFCQEKNKINNQSKILIVMGSSADLKYSEKIESEAKSKYGLKNVDKRICSAHKATSDLLDLLAEYEVNSSHLVIIAVAGRSNGLGPVISANCTYPVINAPPITSEWLAQDIWSSMRMPSGIGCTTVLGAEEAALAACKILSQTNFYVFSRILIHQTKNVSDILISDQNVIN